jgi:AcrR family transcriptional regulator
MDIHTIFVYFFLIRKILEKTSNKLSAILEAAKSLFWKHGIRRVTIEEICQAAAVSKMTFYKYFSNKTAIARYLLEDIFEKGMVTYRDILSSNIPYDEKIKKTIELKISNASELSQDLIDDIYKYRDEELNSTIEDIKNRVVETYLEDFRLAQQQGNIRPDIKPEFIIYLLERLTEMITDKRLVSLYPDPGHMISEIMSFFFYGIGPLRKESSNE